MAKAMVMSAMLLAAYAMVLAHGASFRAARQLNKQQAAAAADDASWSPPFFETSNGKYQYDHEHDMAYYQKKGLMNTDATVTQLDEYVKSPSPHYGWQGPYDQVNIGNEATAYFFAVQTADYLTPQLTDRSVWNHSLVYVIPKNKNPNCETAYYWMTWGSNNQAKWKVQDDVDVLVLVGNAVATGCPAVGLFDIPNQPICFYDVPNKPFCDSEDSAIGYTFNRFLYQNKSVNWLLLFPMTKAGILGMNAVEEISQQYFQWPVSKFVVSGASKRGWTTWLVGATDPKRSTRISAIVPFVLDAINFRSFLTRQWMSYSAYTFALQPYVGQGLADATVSPLFDVWAQNIDPFLYINRLTMPKLAINAVGDEFQLLEDQSTWAKFMPGELHTILIKDADHILVTNFDLVLKTCTGFFSAIVNQQPRPTIKWTIDPVTATITATPSAVPDKAEIVWSTTPQSRPYNGMRDFRDVVLDNTPCIIHVLGGCVRFVLWDSKTLAPNADGTSYTASMAPPVSVNSTDTTYLGFYIQFTFKSAVAGGLDQIYATPASITPNQYSFAACDPSKGQCLERYV